MGDMDQLILVRLHLAGGLLSLTEFIDGRGKMMSITMLKMAAVIGVAAVVAGCASKPRPQAEIQAQYPRKVTLHTRDSIRNASRDGRPFAVISAQTPGSDTWELISVTTTFPQVAVWQEVFLVSDDLTKWETTVPRQKDCSKPSAGYSICGSTLAKKDLLGNTNYDAEAVIRAVNSIPDVQAKPVMQRYLEAEDVAQIAIYEQKSKEQAECYRLHDAGTREIEAAGGKAMSAAIAGKPLTPDDLIAIRRVQSRMSSSSACGFNVQPPKKRASAVSAK